MAGAGLPLGTGQKCMALSFAESAGNMACSACGTLMVVHNGSAETVELDIHTVQLLLEIARAICQTWSFRFCKMAEQSSSLLLIFRVDHRRRGPQVGLIHTCLGLSRTR